jgi:2-haloacid dehalogenase
LGGDGAGAETWPRARGRFDFWDCFEGIVISGEVRLAKPDPAIFAHAIERFALDAPSTLFIDDSETNVSAARDAGWQALCFTNVLQLRRDLAERGVSCGPG